MADREINAPNGMISVDVSLKGAKGGNEILAQAKLEAAAIAAVNGKEINPDDYGTKRVGELVTITFAIKG